MELFFALSHLHKPRKLTKKSFDKSCKQLVCRDLALQWKQDWRLTEPHSRALKWIPQNFILMWPKSLRDLISLHKHCMWRATRIPVHITLISTRLLLLFNVDHSNGKPNWGFTCLSEHQRKHYDFQHVLMIWSIKHKTAVEWKHGHCKWRTSFSYHTARQHNLNLSVMQMICTLNCHENNLPIFLKPLHAAARALH